jgi:hypothetical protein
MMKIINSESEAFQIAMERMKIVRLLERGHLVLIVKVVKQKR